jgi:hypothetical protein
VQPSDKDAKPYQVREFLEMVKEHGLYIALPYQAVLVRRGPMLDRRRSGPPAVLGARQHARRGAHQHQRRHRGVA